MTPAVVNDAMAQRRSPSKMYLVLFLEFPSPDHSYVAPFVIIGAQETSKLKGVTV